MKVAITTPTGNIGSRVVQLALQAGIRPTVLVRNPDRLRPDVREAVDIRQGSLADADFVTRATEGVDALFWLIPSDFTVADPVAGIVSYGQNAASAIRQNGIERTVFVSSLGADLRDNSLIGGLGQVEDLLNEAAPNVTHLRPGYFYTNLLMSLHTLQQGILPTTVPLDLAIGWTDPRDIGDIATARLLSTGWSGSVIQPVLGTEELTHADVARIIGEATGKPIQAVQIGDDDLRGGLNAAGMPPAFVEAYVTMSRRIGYGPAPEDRWSFASSGPTSLGAWAYANLKPILA